MTRAHQDPAPEEEVEAREESRMLIDRAAWRLVLVHLRPRLGRIFIFILASLVIAGLALATPVLIRYTLNTAAPGGDLSLLIGLGLALLGARLLLIAVNLWARRLMQRTITDSMKALRLSVLSAMLGFERAFYARSDPGALQPRFIQNTERVEGMLGALFNNTLPSLLTGVLLGSFVLWLEYRVIIILAAAAPLMLIVQRYGTRRIQETFRVFRDRMEDYSRSSYFFIRNTDLVHMQAAEEQALRTQEKSVGRLTDATNRRFDAQLYHAQAQSFLAAILLVVIIIGGGASVITGHNTIGDVVAIFAALQILQGASTSVFGAIPTIITGNESLSKLHELVSSGRLIAYSGETEHQMSDQISLNDVDFQYDRAPILTGAEICLPLNGVSALIGKNGSGKTTVLNLILGLERPDKGQVSCDGIPFDKLDLSFLRKQVGISPQSPMLFPGSVRENILFGSENISEDQLQRAVDQSNLAQVLAGLPEGLETEIGDNGVMLSGGQRQRIAIARAIARAPKLLIFDEPTNHLDNGTIAKIFSALLEQEDPPAILMVSHDEKAIRFADRIFRVEDGIILAEQNTMTAQGL
ncbi:MAG: ABC transporter ATP-binding protein [Pseudomonadota bacterium]